MSNTSCFVFASSGGGAAAAVVATRRQRMTSRFMAADCICEHLRHLRITLLRRLRRWNADESQRPTHRGHDDAQLVHQPRELVGVERLRAVADGFLRLMVYFDENAVRA